jgi:type IV pilus assembly protein PilF
MTRAIAAALLGATLLGCPSASTPVKKDEGAEKLRDQAGVHFDLGVNAQGQGDVRAALNEFQLALQIDPTFADAESERHYRRALELRPDDSQARLNLAALELDLSHYDEAIALDEQVLQDLHYKSSYLAANNEGWAYYRKGQTEKALSLIKETVRVNPDFCQGYRNLGLIYSDQNQLELAQLELDRMVKKCPDSPQAHYELGRVELKRHQEGPARAAFGRCRDKAKEGEALLEECSRLASGGRP